jgi:TetR/AcrR family transcriptional regulator, transcriptional repressor for nem operon
MTQTVTEADTPIAGIQAIFDELAAGIGSDSGAMGCFMVNSVAELVPYDPDVTEIAAAYSDTLQRMLAEVLRGAIQQGTVTKGQTPEQLAAYVFNTMQGIRILIKSGATHDQIQAISAITLNSLQ